MYKVIYYINIVQKSNDTKQKLLGKIGNKSYVFFFLLFDSHLSSVEKWGTQKQRQFVLHKKPNPGSHAKFFLFTYIVVKRIYDHS